MTTANKLTLLRILLIPFFIISLYINIPGSAKLALAIFIIASVTDALDGYIARSRNQITTFGVFMDPLADKLLVTSALICFVEFGYIYAWIAFTVIAREFIVTGIRIAAMHENTIISAGTLGKLKTVSQITAICAILMRCDTHLKIINDTLSSIIRVDITAALIWIMLILTIISGIDYVVRNRKFLRM